jgi:hypothetical protein
LVGGSRENGPCSGWRRDFCLAASIATQLNHLSPSPITTMPPRIRLASTCVHLAIRTRPIASVCTPRAVLTPQYPLRAATHPRRFYADEKKPQSWRGLEEQADHQHQPAEPAKPAESAGDAKDGSAKTVDVGGPNTDPLPGITEEAAAIGEITGSGGPAVEQGTPVQEVSLDSSWDGGD